MAPDRGRKHWGYQKKKKKKKKNKNDLTTGHNHAIIQTEKEKENKTMTDIVTYLDTNAPDFETYMKEVEQIHIELCCETIGNWAKRNGIDLHATDANGKNIFVNFLTGHI